MQSICIGSRKGGAGKTTTAINLAGALVEHGWRVALVDLDPQASLTRLLLGGEQPSDGIGARILNPALGLDGLVRATPMGVDLFPGDRSIENAALSLAENPMGALRLRKLVRSISDYDALLLDTPPALGFALSSALLAADYAVLPTVLVQQDLDALQDTLDLAIELSELGAGPVAAIVPNQYRPFKNDTAALAALQATWGATIADPIPQSESVKVALNRAIPVVQHDPRSHAAAAYRALAQRVVMWRGEAA